MGALVIDVVVVVAGIAVGVGLGRAGLSAFFALAAALTRRA